MTPVFSQKCHNFFGFFVFLSWPVRKENGVALQQAEMRMVRWMCTVKVKDRVPSKEFKERLGIGDYNLGTTAKQAAMV